MKVLLITLMLFMALLLTAERLNPERKLRVIMTDEESMPLDDGFYNVVFRIYDKSTNGVVIGEKNEFIESKNGVSIMLEQITDEFKLKGYKEIWVSLKIEDQPEPKFKTRIFLDPVK